MQRRQRAGGVAALHLHVGVGVQEWHLAAVAINPWHGGGRKAGLWTDLRTFRFGFVYRFRPITYRTVLGCKVKNF